MAHSLTIRQPTQLGMRPLETVLEACTHPDMQRRAEVILDCGLGFNGIDIAAALQVHPNTIYADLYAFEEQGCACLHPLPIGGARSPLTAKQCAEIWRLAQCSPQEFGLDDARWSLANFQDFLIHKRRLLKTISRKHLRRVLKKRYSF